MLQDGRARVIVELRLPVAHVPEGALGDRLAVARQRQRIADAADAVLARLAAGSHREVRRFATVPHLVLEVTPASLAALEQMPDAVLSIAPDAILRPSLAERVPLIEADQAWSNGFDGTGVTIAILDTGVDKTHPFLTGKVVGEACYSTTTAGTSQTFCPNGLDQQIGSGAAMPCPLPNCEHGTHVAGKQDNVAWFSNTAPFLSLFAPGDSITSSAPGGGYEALSGTSMATPHVAGV